MSSAFFIAQFLRGVGSVDLVQEGLCVGFVRLDFVQEILCERAFYARGVWCLGV